MSVKTITIKVCDSCNKEIKGRLIARRCPCCKADICRSCQRTEDAKVKDAPVVALKKTSKPKLGDTRVKDGQPEAYVKAGEDIKVGPNNVDIKTPVGDEKLFRIRILDSFAEGENLVATIEEALKPWGGKMPLGLSIEDTALLEGILKVGE